MDLHKMIAELQAEKERLDQAIEALERLYARGDPRRGRPPSWLKRQTEQVRESEKNGEPENTLEHTAGAS